MAIFILSFVLWALLHSVTAAQWVKDLALQGLGERRYRAFYRMGYVVFSLVTFVPVLALYWQLPDTILWSVPSPWRWLMVGIQLLGLFGLLVSILQTHALAFVGLRQMVDYLNGQQDLTKAGLGEELYLGGLYRYMRHPLYTFSLLLLWFMPVVTRNYLVFTLLATAYFIVGSIFEERRLVQDFGQAYADYKRRVPRFIPRPWKTADS